MLVMTDEGQAEKMTAAVRRGDVIPVSQEALDEAAGLYRDVVVEAMASGDLSGVAPAAELIAELLATDAQETVLDGDVEGPARTAAWESRKGNNLKLAGLTGDLVASLHGETRER